jgi:hypothetical protein
MVFSKKEFAAVFDTQIGPFLSDGGQEKFLFEDLLIDDTDPSTSDAHAYLELKASSKRQTITIGINLLKEVVNDQVTRLYISNITGNGDVGGNKVAVGDLGWKCTSVRTECGGCRRIRENGIVTGCPCISGEGYCNFETTGGGGNNWPGWLTSFILAILKFV